jgi:lactate/malate dehydrogenase, NAD binding domain
VAAIDFVTGNHANVLQPGELLRNIHLPVRALRKRFASHCSSLTHLGRSAVFLIRTRSADEDDLLLTMTACGLIPKSFAELPSAAVRLALGFSEGDWRAGTEHMMKVGIVGVGAVGAATAMAVALRARVRELILVNRNRVRAKAVATDMHYGVPLSPLVRIADGDYSDLAGAGLVIITAGVNEKAGGATDRNDPVGRLRLLDSNVKVFKDIVPRIVEVAPQAVLLVATDPPEPLADVARNLADHNRVIGTSTDLDSLRSAYVDAYVIGEHGTSSVFLWSSAAYWGLKSGGFACPAADRILRVSPGRRA